MPACLVCMYLANARVFSLYVSRECLRVLFVCISRMPVFVCISRMPACLVYMYLVNACVCMYLANACVRMYLANACMFSLYVSRECLCVMFV